VFQYTSNNSLLTGGGGGGGAPNRSFIEIMEGERLTSIGVLSETNWSNRILFQPFWMDGVGLEPKTIRMLVSGIASSNRSMAGTLQVALYSAVNSSQLSLFGTASQAFSITESAASTAWNGFRALDFTGMTGTMTNEGRWAVAILKSMSSNNATYANVNVYGADPIPAFSGYLSNGSHVATNSQSQIFPFWGGYSATTGAFPNSVADTQINGNVSQSMRDIYYVIKQI
jgi:hypothetical protein